MSCQDQDAAVMPEPHDMISASPSSSLDWKNFSLTRVKL
ncbi:hypothetical protein JCM19236_710 [Vibrio sp. JCM 19236]|nr:hypothetical protein JCM19236_710 [Vibrio sp. JCM 19236]